MHSLIYSILIYILRYLLTCTRKFRPSMCQLDLEKWRGKLHPTSGIFCSKIRSKSGRVDTYTHWNFNPRGCYPGNTAKKSRYDNNGVSLEIKLLKY